ncbi:cryptochrome-2 [Holospora obtusa F1]|uniref:Deoxyribodipyrimidine photo-lyase n=1 Tax=Holospora obtusa F1 TaxID=1399147 RepID=W6TDH8_HOLOB|nr:deoxyribodipyrimidine photo-lyase [Holospora obtusa]ETZ07103.1 cryptochrome-2 [Holospora obtusa F1]
MVLLKHLRYDQKLMLKNNFMTSVCSMFWFRNDLRLLDNPGLVEASKLGEVFPIYILDESIPSFFKQGKASKIYLHYSLEQLNESLSGKLNIYRGDAQKIIFELFSAHTRIKNIFWNLCYDPWQFHTDQIIEKKLGKLQISCKIFNGSYLWNPQDIKKEDGGHYKVFSAYQKKVYTIEPRKPLSLSKHIQFIKDENNRTTLQDLDLLSLKNWNNKIESYWTFGEKSAQKKLYTFLQCNLAGYKKGRDYPGNQQTSKLSASLHFGEISPHQIWEAVHKIRQEMLCEEDIRHFLSEIIWREFSCYLMFHFPELPWKNFKAQFDNFPWTYHNEYFEAWKSGNTGHPIVDAGMRELLQTGYMHNRVRMIVASFLVKNLMIHWSYGQDWFWERLVDADLANNSASWQWVAGCGADAAPYFRIFNPTLQGETFDPHGHYTKQFLPILNQLPSQYLFKPWKASAHLLKQAGIVLGENYPFPIVDLKFSRERALSAYTAC